jgi:hypothetical protein
MSKLKFTTTTYYYPMGNVAAFYYGKNFGKVKEVVDIFNPNDAKFIQNAQQLFNDNSIKNKLSVILSNFQCTTDTITITCLEKSGVNLGKSLELV